MPAWDRMSMSWWSCLPATGIACARWCRCASTDGFRDASIRPTSSRRPSFDVARAPEYAANPTMLLTSGSLPTAQRLMILHRHHLGARARAGQEVSLYRGVLPPGHRLARRLLLLGRLTSPTQACSVPR